MHRRAELGERAALVGIVGNIFLSAAKFVVGIVAGSTAVIADALHSFSDVIISALTWLGIRIAKKPPDREHQLGHYDVEPIVGLIVSIVLAVIGFEFARYSLSMLYSPQIPKTSAIYITIFAIFFKEAMTRYTLSIAQKIRSPALKADAMHHRSDVYSSILVLLGVAGAILGYPALDPIAGIAVSILVFKIGVDVGKENIVQLMGSVPSPELAENIDKLVRGVAGVKHLHRIRIHGLGAYASVDLHVCVDEKLPLAEAHKIAHEVQRKIVESFPEISSALVHIEPYDVHHRENHT